MDLQAIMSQAKGMFGGTSNVFSAIADKNKKGGGDPKTKKDIISDEMKVLYKKNLPYDNKNVKDVVNSAAKKTGVSPSMLFSSAFQEGMNKAVAKPDEISDAFFQAGQKGKVDSQKFPVDSFYNYGLDTFGNNYSQLKKYLPADFEQQFQLYDATNEKGEKIRPAAFKNNESALMAKGAFIRNVSDQVDAYAMKNNIKLDDKAKQYFTLAGYNGGEGTAYKMMDEYNKSRDKAAFLDHGLTSQKEIHKNISSRLGRLKLADELLNEKDEVPPLENPAAVATK